VVWARGTYFGDGECIQDFGGETWDTDNLEDVDVGGSHKRGC
jgi:hypothetical protein